MIFRHHSTIAAIISIRFTLKLMAMKNLRTHMWLCFTLGVFLLIALILTYFVMVDINHSSESIGTMPEAIQVWIINLT